MREHHKTPEPRIGECGSPGSSQAPGLYRAACRCSWTLREVKGSTLYIYIYVYVYV